MRTDRLARLAAGTAFYLILLAMAAKGGPRLVGVDGTVWGDGPVC